MSLHADQDMLDYVRREILMSNESIVWKGRPSPWRAMRIALGRAFSGLFSIISTAAFWGVVVFLAWQFGFLDRVLDFTADFNWFIWLVIAIIFGWGILKGFWEILKPLWIFWRARRTYYAVTDRRVLIVFRGFWKSFASILPAEIVRHERTDFGNGRGNIRQRKSVPGADDGDKEPRVEFEDGLWGIENVRGADDAITALRERSSN